MLFFYEFFESKVQLLHLAFFLLPLRGFVSQQDIFYLSDRWMAKDHAQSDIGEMMGWSRDKIGKYALLEKISPIAWEKIVTVFSNNVTMQGKDGVTSSVTTVTITEGLLQI